MFIAILPLSCATKLHPPNGSFSMAGNNSVIFGKVEVTINDLPTGYNGDSLLDPKFILMHISRYISDETINKNPWKAGEYFFKVNYDQAGYFAVVVPPGKYYFVEFDYCGIIPGMPMIGARTYMPIKGVVKNPYLMIFDVPPDHAVYIGTIKNEFHPTVSNLFYHEVEYTVGYAEDYVAAQKWFLKSNPALNENIVEGVTEIKPISVTDGK
jgi:hypothetical protein